MRFLRAEWTPSKVDNLEVQSVFDAIYPGLFHEIIADGYVTQIDLTVDIEGVKCDDLLFHYPKSTITKTMTSNGRTEYIGGETSTTRWRIYNKKAETEKKNKQKAKPLHETIPESELTRIELVSKPYCHLLDLPDKTNKFDKLTVSAFSNLVINNDPYWGVFLDSCRLIGAKSALLKLTESTIYDRYTARIKHGLVDWWNPDVIWSQLPAVIANIANIPLPENHAA